MTIVVETPSERIRIQKPDCIGRFYIIYAPEFDRRVLATCIDATTDGKPKRMRIQRCMDHGGKVLMSHQYEIIEKNPLWED